MNRFLEWARESKSAKLVPALVAVAVSAGCAVGARNLESRVNDQTLSFSAGDSLGVERGDYGIIPNGDSLGPEPSGTEFDNLVYEGHTLYEKGNYQEAAETLTQAIELYQDGTDYDFDLSDVKGLLAESHYRLDDFEKALDVAPEDSYLFRGDCYSKLEKGRAAFELYEKGLEANPNDPEAHFRVALSYAGRWKVTKDDSDKEIAIERYLSASALYGACEECGDVSSRLSYIHGKLSELYKSN